ncbi:TetR family transcriptional regulator [Marmoricola endophyticus]|uniref:TetR family transcriptional regulator n=2 Tax=Marmoricola endophyticus TaxID=2040280 RepID=A0A917F427_9ACTN|nr:TetR family transcriptional regulator [Marmoricola endophyticus]
MRQRRRRQSEGEIRDAAMELFARQGYAATTIAQIADAAGVSPRTFFRYFRCKEDVVVDSPVGYGADLAHALAERPPGEPVWEATAAALRMRTRRWQERPADAHAVVDLLTGETELAARMTGKTDEWTTALAAAARERLDPPEDTRALRARSIVGAVVACLDAAFGEWQRSPGADLDQLFDLSLETVADREDGSRGR